MKITMKILFLFLSVGCYSQHLLINNSLTYSKVSGDYEILNETIHNYYFGMEMTFLEKEDKVYYLSGEIGVLRKGGKKRNFYLNNVRMDLEEKFDYFILNPSFRMKIPFPSSHIYFGAGPRMDVLISKKEFESLVYQDLEAESLIFGASFEVGAIYDIKDFRLGFQGQYNLDLTKLTNSDLNLKGNTITFGLLLGYRFF